MIGVILFGLVTGLVYGVLIARDVKRTDAEHKRTVVVEQDDLWALESLAADVAAMVKRPPYAVLADVGYYDQANPRRKRRDITYLQAEVMRKNLQDMAPSLDVQDATYNDMVERFRAQRPDRFKLLENEEAF